MSPIRRARATEAGLFAAVVLLPLLGAALRGDNLRSYFQFPPALEIPGAYVTFSWLAVALVALVLGAVFAPWLVVRRATIPPPPPNAEPISARRFPAWGWVALVWTLAWWVLAWTRFDWFAPLQHYTFFPLWLGFIVVVNAGVERSGRACLLRRAPRAWLALFAASAVFWWGFEWLNRFVRNWHYLAVEDFGPLGYAVHATLCFSTVLPAVAAVAEWLDGSARWCRGTSRGPAWTWLARPIVAAALAGSSGAALVFCGVQPDWFYPALWVAPLMLWLALPGSRGRALALELARGDWRRAATWMMAGLICGFFWELWNWQSLAKWIYTVPGVERWHVFEMPLLGYAGYLPFGLECLLVAESVAGIAPAHFGGGAHETHETHEKKA